MEKSIFKCIQSPSEQKRKEEEKKKIENYYGHSHLGLRTSNLSGINEVTGTNNGFIYKWFIMGPQEQIYQVGCQVNLG